MYLPSKGLPFDLRSFILAILEMLRRWQWNFRKPRHPSYLFYSESDDFHLVRLENEHLGNIDQYRATRDVPLPYQFDSAKDSDVEDWDRPCASKKRWVGRIFKS